MSGHYSCLPKRIVPGCADGYSRSVEIGRPSETLHVRSANWHRISRSEWSTCEPLVRFLQTLDFCNLAVRVWLSFGNHCLELLVSFFLMFHYYQMFLFNIFSSRHRHLTKLFALFLDLSPLCPAIPIILYLLRFSNVCSEVCSEPGVLLLLYRSQTHDLNER